MPENDVEIGFHVTDKANAELILKGGFKIKEYHDIGWLGTGIYFWINLEDAKRWTNIMKSANIRTMLKANIKLGNCLDLTTEEGKKFFRAQAQKLIGFMKNSFRPDINKRKLNEGILVDYLIKKAHFDFDSVKAIYYDKDVELFINPNLYLIERMMINIIKTINITNCSVSVDSI